MEIIIISASNFQKKSAFKTEQCDLGYFVSLVRFLMYVLDSLKVKKLRWIAKWASS